MSGAGNCYDNAAVESWFGLLKRERVNRRRYRTRQEARLAWSIIPNASTIHVDRMGRLEG